MVRCIPTCCHRSVRYFGRTSRADIYKEDDNKNPVEIASNAIKFAKSNSNNVVIFDTAGRLAID